jgi:hypothetical protein
MNFIKETRKELKLIKLKIDDEKRILKPWLPTLLSIKSGTPFALGSIQNGPRTKPLT